MKKLMYFRKRMQAVIISGLRADDFKLVGTLHDPINTDDMQKGRKRKGNGAQPSHPTMVQGAVNGICDATHYRYGNFPSKHNIIS